MACSTVHTSRSDTHLPHTQRQGQVGAAAFGPSTRCAVVPLAPGSLGKEFSSAPLKTQHLWGGEGIYGMQWVQNTHPPHPILCPAVDVLREAKLRGSSTSLSVLCQS